jgi:hypothetical protein
VGKPEVFAYASFYLTGFLNEKPLASCAADLAALGLARDERAGDRGPHRLRVRGHALPDRRRRRRHLQPRTAAPLLPRPPAALGRHAVRHRGPPARRGLGAVAGFTRAFMQVETQGFDLLE